MGCCSEFLSCFTNCFKHDAYDSIPEADCRIPSKNNLTKEVNANLLANSSSKNHEVVAVEVDLPDK